MTTQKEIKKKLFDNGIRCTDGDSDETTVVVWNEDFDKEKIKKALKGMNYFISDGLGFGPVIVPKK